MERHGQRMTKGRRRRRAAIAAGAALPLLGALLWRAVPSPDAWLGDPPLTTVLADREGRPLRVLPAADGQDRRRVPLSEMGEWLPKAIVAAEDGRFHRHAGVDLLAIARATAQNLARGRVVSGASTISTQVVRLAQPRPRTFATKAIEALLALKMERSLTKDEILEEYLNRAPFGGPLVGAQAAARRYFGRDARDLGLGEAALLAGLPQSPARLRPDRRLDRALRRRAYVLDRMVRCGFITPEQRDAAAATPVVLDRSGYPLDAAHFAESARRARSPGLPGGLVRTTLDPALQRRVEAAVRGRVAALRPDGVRGGAAVVLEVRTGAVRALAGVPDVGEGDAAGWVNGAAARRSAGSTLKPLLFALAFDEGRLGPATVLADVPRTYPDYAPENFDGSFRGLVPARTALSDSLNIPALDLAQAMGAARLHRGLLEFGLRTLDRPTADYGLGLALGNGEVTLLDLANAYAAIARGGVHRPVAWFEDEAAPAETNVVSPEAAWLVSEILGDPERAAPDAGPSDAARRPRMAWKTGTSSGFRDAWTVAWNPEVVVAVWLGNPDGAPSPALVGGAAAAPAAWEILRGFYPAGGGPWFARPAGLREREVCAVSGRAPTAQCRARATDWSIEGVTRCDACTVHGPDAAGGDAVAERWPEDVERFLARGRAAPPAGPGATAAPPRIVSPRPGAPYRRWTPGGGAATWPLVAESGGAARLWWYVDGRAIGSARPGDPVWWTPEPGAHRLVCSDGAGAWTAIDVRVE